MKDAKLSPPLLRTALRIRAVGRVHFLAQAVLGIGLLISAAVPTRGASSDPIPPFSHIFLIVMENREASAVVDSPDAPYLASLASRYAVADRYFGITHPSLPNYLALTGGDTFGIGNNCTDCPIRALSLADQLEEHHKTWKAYLEGFPGACFDGASADRYVKKHNPFVYYTRITEKPERCARQVPLSQLQGDLAQDAVPDFVWITPDNCHNMHDCLTRVGDDWLKTIVPQIRASRAWANRGVLFVVWDEGATREGCCGGSGGGRVALFAISPLSKPGYRSQTTSSHYSLLRTIEDAWSLGHLRHAGDPATNVLFDLFATPR